MASLLDPQLALDVARRATGAEPPTTADERAEIGRSLRAAFERADGAVRSFTGWTEARAVATPQVLNRSAWVEANLRALGPVFERAGAQLPISALARPVLRVATSVQLGLLFGYLSRKVIGQYDLFGAGQLYVVGPNVVETERRARVDPEDFRLWVALHEVTHALQDGGVPWLHGEITGFVDRSLEVMRRGPSVARIVGAVRETIVHRRPVGELLDVVLAPEQRALLRTAQALMSIVEGHASFVMDRVGETMIEDVAGLRRRVEGARRKAVGPEKTVQTAIGLDAKRRQYDDGQRFFEAITRVHGPDAARTVFDRPGNIPSLDELADPHRWAERVLAVERGA